MAYDVDRKPGVFAKGRESSDLRVAVVFLGLVIVGIVACAGLLLTRTSSLVSALALVCVALVAKCFFETRMALAVRWGKGGNAEAAVGADLDSLRNEGYVVLHDLEHVVPGNVDHVISGPTGAFMIETKFRSYVNSDIPKAKRAALTIAQQIGVPWVQPVICVTTRSYGPRIVKGVAVVGREQLRPYIRAQQNRQVAFERFAAFADRQ